MSPFASSNWDVILRATVDPQGELHSAPFSPRFSPSLGAPLLSVGKETAFQAPRMESSPPYTYCPLIWTRIHHTPLWNSSNRGDLFVTNPYGVLKGNTITYRHHPSGAWKGEGGGVRGPPSAQCGARDKFIWHSTRCGHWGPANAG